MPPSGHIAGRDSVLNMSGDQWSGWTSRFAIFFLEAASEISEKLHCAYTSNLYRMINFSVLQFNNAVLSWSKF